MHWSDYLNPKHDWSDRWHPIVVLELRPVWKRLRWVFGLGYPLSCLAAWLLVYQPSSGWLGQRLEIAPALYFGAFGLLSLVVPLHVSGQIQQGFQKEAFEDLLLTALTREQLIIGYVHWSCLLMALVSGLTFPFLLLDCWQQQTQFHHALLIVFACWTGSGANAVLSVCLSLQGRFKMPWWRQVAGGYPLLLLPLTIGVPGLVMFLLVNLDSFGSSHSPLRRLFDRESDSVWWFWLLLIPWATGLYFACRYVTRWTARLLDRYPAK